MSNINSEKLNFILEATKSHKHTGRTFFDHLLQTSGIVEKLCQQIGIQDSQYLVDAALFHSIYGTDYYEFNEQITREKVISLICPTETYDQLSLIERLSQKFSHIVF